MKKIILSVGTRPNFVKVTRFKSLAKAYADMQFILVHTGQHYDQKMSDVFFGQFGLKPDYFLHIPAAGPNTQIAEIMLRMEQLLLEHKPDLIMVPGDVNSTLAVALTANKMNIPLAHIESGLRSFDFGMPEEYNRLLTDHLSDLCFVTEQSGMKNLIREGKQEDKIHFVGNTMIDALVAYGEDIDRSGALEQYGLGKGAYILMTMHRPATVDHKKGFERLMHVIGQISALRTVVFPVHPRTLKNAEAFGCYDALKEMQGLILTPPLDYFAFQQLVKNAFAVITDSGGIQEETTYYRIPCITLRDNTERPVTIDRGTNILMPLDPDEILARLRSIASGDLKKGEIPPMWDGRATERILRALHHFLYP